MEMIVFYIIALVGVILFVFGISYEDTVSIYEKLKGEKKKLNPLSVLSKPFLPLSSLMVKKLDLESSIKKQLVIARWNIAADEFFSYRLLFMLIFPLVAYFFFEAKEIGSLAAVSVGGFVAPGFVLAGAVRRRQDEILRALPETIDFLSLYIGAGLDFTGAMRWLVRNAKVSALIEEFATVLEDIRVGKSRAQALKDMARRLEIPELSSFILTLVQSERMGTPVEETFDILSEDFRMFRYQKGQREASKAPIKLLIPLIFCILPIIGIIVATPIFLKFKYSGWFGGQ
jgi:tight adherence protein C